MKIRLCLPHGYGSGPDDCMAWDACKGPLSGIYLPIANAAEKAGLAFVQKTDHGRIWEGTSEQIETCRMMLPVWATNYTSIVEE